MINPKGISFVYWANTLTTDFPNDTIPKILDESQWRWWGDIVASSPTFVRSGAPRTADFSNPQEWAERLYAVIG